MDMVELADPLADCIQDAPASPCAPQAAVAAPASSLYGSFFLASTEFALPVGAIQEVVVFPARVTAIPLAPPFLIGVFNLRGTIVPVIELRSLLSLPDQTAIENRKIAIVDFDGTRVGLVFDETGEMLRVQAADMHAFHYADDDPHHVIKGALKLAGGERIVQVLDPRALLMIEQVPQILDKQRSDGLHRRGALQQRRQCVSFRLGRTALAFEIEAIHEIIRVPEIQESVLRSDYCAGMFTLRGDVMPLVDFGVLLGMRPTGGELGATGMADERRVIIMELGDQPVGLLVDRVDSIVGFVPDELLPIPAVGARRTAMFAGWISREDSDDIVLLKHAALLSHTELTDLTQGHSRLYAQGKDEGRGGDGRRRERGERQVFITFKLDHLMALPIGDIREIIRPSGDMLTPPGLPPAICGMLNLRRRLVSIVDLRTLYQLEPRGDSAAEAALTKILIVERGADAYGLIVDSVENIVHVYASDKLPVPSMLIDASQKSLRGDLKEIVEVPQSAATAGGPTMAMMIFDIAQLTGRIARLLDD
ncbi:chemotaxis protein CheW [Pararobbsia alpina]|uniref:CheW-like domain-containing protein n=1 Tax=Pararobbsia alpina TaxID=621374 RepID=A0A6S7B292_9BURK|nr:chemotaxis protein CheW [Pararobbsia alpina]CAB3783138.1 hypothetical protein LMG28138_01579 [Pararobbsia alpina]